MVRKTAATSPGWKAILRCDNGLRNQAWCGEGARGSPARAPPRGAASTIFEARPMVCLWALVALPHGPARPIRPLSNVHGTGPREPYDSPIFARRARAHEPLRVACLAGLDRAACARVLCGEHGSRAGAGA